MGCSEYRLLPIGYQIRGTRQYFTLRIASCKILLCDTARSVTSILLFFFFQAEDGIRDYKVTGVQTCALPISGVIGVPTYRRALPGCSTWSGSTRGGRTTIRTSSPAACASASASRWHLRSTRDRKSVV